MGQAEMGDGIETRTLPDLSGLSILLAEDNPTNQLVATEMLRAMGAAVDVACDGAEAMEMLLAQDYDVLIVDIEMPRISGLDVVRAVRGSGGAAATRPVLALTAYPREDHGARILAAGADAVLTKPVESIAALGETILDSCGRGPRTPFARRIAPEAEGAAGGGIDPVDAAELAALLRSVGEASAPELLRRMTDDIGDAAEAVRRAAPAGDVAALRRACHVLSAVAGTAGAERLRALAAELHRIAADAEPSGAQAAIEAAGRAGRIEALSRALLDEGARVAARLRAEQERRAG